MPDDVPRDPTSTVDRTDAPDPARTAAAAVVALLLVALITRSDSRQPACPSELLEVGVVGNADGTAVSSAASLGAQVLRVEFEAGTPLAEVGAEVAAAAARGVQLQPLIGWAKGAPAPDLTFLAGWARTFGPYGSFWSGGRGHYAVTEIELGNENSYAYKSGDPHGPEYGRLARTYGTRALEAARAVEAANPGVGLLVELESGGTDSDAWVSGVLGAGGGQLVDLMRGPVVHAYGPGWRTKLERERSRLAAHGVDKPYFMTEWGVATDDGQRLGDNLGFPADLTYDDAGRLVDDAVATMAALPTQLRQVLLYQARDQRMPGTGAREHYFGLLTVSGADKGDLTRAARTTFSRYSCRRLR